MENAMIKNLSAVNLGMINTVGGKNASLGEMISNLSERGISVPDGFVVTVHAYDEYMKYNGLEERIRNLINSLDVNNLIQLRKTGMEIRQIILDGNFPEHLRTSIEKRYEELSRQYGKDATDVAVRSSATTEDLADALHNRLDALRIEVRLERLVHEVQVHGLLARRREAAVEQRVVQCAVVAVSDLR